MHSKKVRALQAREIQGHVDRIMALGHHEPAKEVMDGIVASLTAANLDINDLGLVLANVLATVGMAVPVEHRTGWVNAVGAIAHGLMTEWAKPPPPATVDG